MAILDAAAAEVRAQGYQGASLSAIAARLGLTKGALTYHFATKSDLITALPRRQSEYILAAAARAADLFPDRPVHRACAFFSLSPLFTDRTALVGAAQLASADTPDLSE